MKHPAKCTPGCPSWEALSKPGSLPMGHFWYWEAELVGYWAHTAFFEEQLNSETPRESDISPIAARAARLERFTQWVAKLDDFENPERNTVTLQKIIERANAALSD